MIPVLAGSGLLLAVKSDPARIVRVVEWFTYRLEPTGRGSELRETRPEKCPNGHDLSRGRVIIGMAETPEGRVRSWECRSCGAITYGRRG